MNLYVNLHFSIFYFSGPKGKVCEGSVQKVPPGEPQWPVCQRLRGHQWSKVSRFLLIAMVEFKKCDGLKPGFDVTLVTYGDPSLKWSRYNCRDLRSSNWLRVGTHQGDIRPSGRFVNICHPGVFGVSSTVSVAVLLLAQTVKQITLIGCSV